MHGRARGRCGRRCGRNFKTNLVVTKYRHVKVGPSVRNYFVVRDHKDMEHELH